MLEYAVNFFIVTMVTTGYVQQIWNGSHMTLGFGILKIMYWKESYDFIFDC